VMLYQLMMGDFRKPLAPGWEAEIEDPLLREDIAEAACGDPAKRLSSAADLAERIRAHGHRHVTYLGGDRARLLDHLGEVTRPGDLVLTLGAGDVGQLGPALLARLEADRADGRATC